MVPMATANNPNPISNNVAAPQAQTLNNSALNVPNANANNPRPGNAQRNNTIIRGMLLVDGKMPAFVSNPNFRRNVVPDALVATAISSFTGTSLKSLYAGLLALEPAYMEVVVRAAYEAATGGIRAIQVDFPGYLRNTLWHITVKGKDRWNSTAMSLLGHVLIKMNLNESASIAFRTKYDYSDIWEMAADDADHDYEEESDIAIKCKQARNVPWSEEAGEAIATVVASHYVTMAENINRAALVGLNTNLLAQFSHLPELPAPATDSKNPIINSAAQNPNTNPIALAVSNSLQSSGRSSSSTFSSSSSSSAAIEPSSVDG